MKNSINYNRINFAKLINIVHPSNISTKNHRRRCGFEMKKIIVERERKIRRRKKKKEEKRTIFQGFLRASVEGRCQGQGRRQGQGLGVPILVE